MGWGGVRGGNCWGGREKMVVKIGVIKGIVGVLGGGGLWVRGVEMERVLGNGVGGGYVVGMSWGGSVGVGVVVVGGMG